MDGCSKVDTMSLISGKGYTYVNRPSYMHVNSYTFTRHRCVIIVGRKCGYIALIVGVAMLL